MTPPDPLVGSWLLSTSVFFSNKRQGQQKLIEVPALPGEVEVVETGTNED